MFKRVLVPLDGSAFSEQALVYGAEIAEKFGAPLTLLHAYEGPEQSIRAIAQMPAGPAGGMMSAETVDAITEAAEEAGPESQQYLNYHAGQLQARGLQVDTLIADAAPADAILQAVDNKPDALVVMCTHGRGGLGRLVFGSTAQDVLHRCRTPLLMIRAVEVADEAKEGG
jgi:nucleotide-binding universal stress UspA family protein